MDKPKLLACISGGETSGLMAYILNKRYGHLYDIVFTFQNTTREDNRTLDFVNNISINWGINIVWLEAVINPEKGKGITHRVVNYDTAKRDGSVFEAHIAKYGIPSSKSPHCTRDLKSNCAKDYARSIGWDKYIKAIGFRYDEPKRVNLVKAELSGQWYPLYDLKITKEDVNRFWSNQSFRLGIKEFEGNCRLCFKKSKRKLLTQILEDPEAVKWVIDMELKYPYNVNTGEDVYFFRGGESIFDLIEEAKMPFDKWAAPVNNQSSIFDIELDEQENCAESCEAFPIDEE